MAWHGVPAALRQGLAGSGAHRPGNVFDALFSSTVSMLGGVVGLLALSGCLHAENRNLRNPLLA